MIYFDMFEAIHGVLAASGEASRYAASIKVDTPFAKHLEDLGGRTILDRSVQSLIDTVPVNGITFTLNYELREKYLSFLRVLQEKYPNIPFSYTLGLSRSDLLHLSIIRELKAVKSLKDNRYIKLGDPLVALGFGDTVVSASKDNELRRVISYGLPDLRTRNILVVETNFFWRTRIFNLGRLSRLFVGEPDVVDISKYNMACWNINTKRDLADARENLFFLENGCKSDSV